MPKLSGDAHMNRNHNLTVNSRVCGSTFPSIMAKGIRPTSELCVGAVVRYLLFIEQSCESGSEANRDSCIVMTIGPRMHRTTILGGFMGIEHANLKYILGRPARRRHCGTTAACCLNHATMTRSQIFA